MKIVLDPGHGKGNNKSPVNPAYAEGTRMWEYSWLLKSELENYGFEVTHTRPQLTDDPSLSDRGKAAKGKDLFLSLHSNAPGSKIDPKTGEKTYDPSVTGTVAFVSMKNKDNTLAKRLTAKVSALMGHQDRGIMTNESASYPGQDYYGVLRSSSGVGCPNCIILEHGFHTNLADSMWLLKDENLVKLAKEEAKIIAEHYSEKDEKKTVAGDINGDGMINEKDLEELRKQLSGEKSRTEESDINKDGALDISDVTALRNMIDEKEKIYRVQVGAYFVKSGAESKKKKLEQSGFDAIIREKNSIYHVQTGAYTVKENAEKMKKKLEEKGFSAIIKEE